MQKHKFTTLLAILMLTALLGTSSHADNTIIANLGSTQAGTFFDQLIGTAADGAAEVTDGSLPDNCSIESEQRDEMVYFYLRGTPYSAGQYFFDVTVTMQDSTETVMTCALSVEPSVPVIISDGTKRISLGDSVTFSVSASASDGGELSYQWYRQGIDGSLLLEGETADSYTFTPEQTGTFGFFCTVSNMNNGAVSAINSGMMYANVSGSQVTALKIKTLPQKLSFRVGDKLDYYGLTVEAVYSDSSATVESPELQVSPLTLDTAGKQTITVSYKGAVCTYEVQVEPEEEQVESIYAASLPNKTVYKQGERLETTGLTLNVRTRSGTRNISSGFSVTPQTADTLGVQAVTVSYGGKTCVFDVNVEAGEDVVNRISVSVMPKNLSYYVGDKLDTTGLVILVESDSKSTEIVSGFTVRPTELDSTGHQEIVVAYKDKECSFYVTVLERPAETEAQIPIEDEPAETEEASEGSVARFVIVIALAAVAAFGVYVWITERENIVSAVKSFTEKFKR